MSDMDPFGNIEDGWEASEPARDPTHCAAHDYYTTRQYFLMWPWAKVWMACYSCSWRQAIGWHFWWNIFYR